MKEKDLRHAHPLRKLTNQEQAEEEIYRRQLRDSGGFCPGEHPVDVWRREHEEDED